MRRSTVVATIAIVSVALTGVTVQAQDSTVAVASPRETLRTIAPFIGDPGGMLFHTAFHGGFTTRYLLLKSALESKELEKHLALDEKQRSHIAGLCPVTLDLANGRGIADPNEQPDEQVLNPEYFDFLRPDQANRLDVIALRFDGYCALTRKSLAANLNLSDLSRSKIAKATSEIRERLILPRIRWEFAARLPEDIKFQDCYFAGSVCTQLNIAIIDSLTDDECQRLNNLLSADMESGNKAVHAVKQLSPMPIGILALRRLIEAKP